MPSIIRTVGGDIAPEQLGPTDAHEHLFFTTPIQPGDEYTDVDRAIEGVQELARAGARALVDWTPIGLGRDPEALLQVSRATGMSIVAATGVHRDAHYDASDAVRGADAATLADRFTSDLVAARVRSGVVKIGASYHRLQGLEPAVFEAAAEAHRRTGAPLCVHTEHGTMGLELVEHLGRLGVPASCLVLAHLDRNPDPGEHAEVGQAGAYLQYDGPGRAKYWPDSTILDLIARIADRGLADHILLGGDAGRRSMLHAYGGGPGLDYLFRRFKPRLERELGAELSRMIFAANPARAFAFEPRRDGSAPIDG